MGRIEKTTSSHWGAFRIAAENGRLVSAAPFADDPDPSPICLSVPAAVHHEKRVARPSVRRGWLEGGPGRARERRGADEFVALPWDEALDLAAAEIGRVRREHGNGAIYGGSYGWGSAGRFHHAQSQVHRFLNCAGGYVASFASYSTGCAQSIMPHVLGMDFLQFSYGEQTSWSQIARETETLVMFGGIGRKNAQVSMGGVTRHAVGPSLEAMRARGAALVNISPLRTDGWEGSEWLPVRPGTDTALMLGLAFALEEEGLADHAFLARCAEGWERFRPYLTGEADGVAKSPEWAAPLTGIAAGDIRALARRMAGTRCFISVAWALQRQRHGEQPFWMATVLAAMLGQIGLKGGGIGYGYGSIGGVGTPVKRLGGLALPQGRNPVQAVIPVARVADMLLNPGADYDFNGERRTYPDIRLVMWSGGNPFHHHQDLNRLEEAFRRPDTVIVTEPWWTATALRADIVFPATTPYEREDIGRAFSDPFLFHMPKMIEPVGEARDDYAIFSGLAERLGCGAAFTEGRSAEEWITHLYDRFRQGCAEAGLETPSLDELKERNFVELPIEGEAFERTALVAFRKDPEAAPLGTPSGRIEIFSGRIAGFGYDDCPGHPTWFPPEADPAHPLRLVSPQPADKLHSQLECALEDEPGARPAPLSIHPDDAAARGLADGAIARVFNALGACRARVRVTETVLRGVVALPTGAWFDKAEDGTDLQGNPNVLTEDRGTSRLGQGTSAHTASVEVEAG
ncbi:MAG: molybdopterin-dependent oxidoreductase [Pikeienuella sp.]|uniref:molybdopterin-dependent oxidoreductase n=1 Tax=Pikeienuella sp. TaxID=2831957 RepID=UPI00391AD857